MASTIVEAASRAVTAVLIALLLAAACCKCTIVVCKQA
jgi:hypothetical protein